MRHKILSAFGILGFLSVFAIVGLLVFAVIIASFAGSEEVASETTSDEAIASKKVSKEKIYKIGDVVPTEKLEITIVKMEEFDVIGDPTMFGKKASDGGVLVAFQYTLKNVSNEPIGMFSYPSLNLVNDEGTKYSSDIDGSSAYAVETGIDNSKVLSDLNPDISVTETEVYEISKEKFAQGKWFIQVEDKKIQVK